MQYMESMRNRIVVFCLSFFFPLLLFGQNVPDLSDPLKALDEAIIKAQGDREMFRNELYHLRDDYHSGRLKLSEKEFHARENEYLNLIYDRTDLINGLRNQKRKQQNSMRNAEKGLEELGTKIGEQIESSKREEADRIHNQMVDAQAERNADIAGEHTARVARSAVSEVESNNRDLEDIPWEAARPREYVSPGNRSHLTKQTNLREMYNQEIARASGVGGEVETVGEVPPPPAEYKHEKGTMFYAEGMVQDILSKPMSESEFLAYCNHALDYVKQRYPNYSDMYVASSCEMTGNGIDFRFFVSPVPSPQTLFEQQKARSLKEVDEQIAAKKLALSKKLWTLDTYQQIQASLDKNVIENNIHALDHLSQVSKKEVKVSLGSFILKDAPFGIGKVVKRAEDVINGKIGEFIDEGMTVTHEIWDVQTKPDEPEKLAKVDQAVDGYNDVNKIYKNAEKLAKAAGTIDKSIPKEFENGMKALDKSLGNVPSKLTGAIGKYMFFITNRYDLGSAIGLSVANISIYGMKKENQKFIEQMEAEAQQLREEIKELEGDRKSIATSQYIGEEEDRIYLKIR